MTLRTPDAVLDRCVAFVRQAELGVAADVRDLGHQDLVNVAAVLGGFVSAILDAHAVILSDIDDADVDERRAQLLEDLMTPNRDDPSFATTLWQMAMYLDDDADSNGESG